MRYNDSGFTHHHNDTNYLTNMRRNLSLWLSLAPKGSITFGTSEANWRSYFADHLDRMRDANSTVHNLWIMVRAKSARIRDLTQAVDQAKRDGFVQELRANDWQASTENVVRQRDNANRMRSGAEDRALEYAKRIEDLRADLDTITEERDALARAWNGCNEIIDRRNATVAGLQKKVAEQAQAIDFWHDEFLKEAEQCDKQYATLKTRASLIDSLDGLLVKAYARRDVLSRAVSQKEADIGMVKKAAQVEANRVDNLRAANGTQCDMIRRAVAALSCPHSDVWAAGVRAVEILEGRDV